MGIGDWGLGPIPNPHNKKTLSQIKKCIKNKFIIKINKIILF